MRIVKAMSETARARATDPETRHEAADTVDVPCQRGIVLDVLGDESWKYSTDFALTDEQIYDISIKKYGRVVATPQGLRSRRAELMREGYITAYHEGRTSSGRRCRKYCLTEKGLAL